MFKLEYWLSLAACNRCADYYSARNRMEEKLTAAAHRYMLAPEKGNAKSNESEKIFSITKAYAKLVCEHFRVVEQWEHTFPEGILKLPDKCHLSLKLYHRGIESIANAARYAPEPIQSEHVAP